MESQRILDQIQSLRALAELEAGPGIYADRVAEELGPAASRDDLAARDEQLRESLARIDAMAQRAMRIRLDHVLADDTAIAIPTRKVFASTLIGYAHDLGVLEARAREVASRGGSRDPSGVAHAVVEAASATLAVRDVLRTGILELVAQLATASVAVAEGHARDRRLDDPARKAWSAVRRELEAVAAQPDRIAGATLAVRLAGWPEQLDEPDPASEPTFADMIELD